MKICSSADEPDKQVVYFPHTEVKHLKLIKEWPSLAVVTESLVEDLAGEGTPQVYCLCAAPNRSTLRVLKHGLAVNETVIKLPLKPNAMWTLKDKINDAFIRYIVLSQSKSTLVLIIGDDGKIVDHKNTFLETKKPSILVTMMQDSSILQVFPTGYRHIRIDGKYDEFTADSGKISHSTCNGKQLIFNIGYDITYLELNQEGKLVMKGSEKVDSEINCLAVGDVPKDRQRSKLLAVGFADNTVRVFSLDTDSTFLKLSHQALPAAPESVNLMEYDDPTNINEEGGAIGHLFLHVGLKNGHLYKTAIDDTHGTLSETRSRLIGTAPVKLFKMRVGNWQSLIAVSNRVWISYLCKESYLMTPLNCKGIENVSSFNHMMYQHGIVGLGGDILKMFRVEGMGEVFCEKSIALRYTPRKILSHQQTNNLVILEGQHRTYSLAENKFKLQELREKYPKEPNFSETLKLQAPVGTWASCVRVVNPANFETTDLKELNNNETAISMALVDFEQHPNRTFLLVGTIKDYIVMPKSYTGCYIHTFILSEDGRKLELVHSTTIENIPYSMAAYKGKLLAGVGFMLRLYDLGKNQLLKKCEYKHMYMGINRLLTYGDRIFATDLSDSFHLLKHKTRENQFVEIADDVLPRWMTSAAVLDYHTVVGADKFENMFVCRLPEGVDEEGGEDFSTYKFKWEAGYLNGASCKFEQICNYFLGEVATTMHKKALSSTANEVVFYGTASGSLGVMYPLETKEEVDFFLHLEMNMRIQNQPLSGRDHLAFRSYHGASKNVIDGDYCEQFGMMQKDRQINLADELQRKPNEVIKKLEDIRNKIL